MAAILGATAKNAVTDSVDDVWRFQGDASQADDITIMALRYNGPATVEGESELTLKMVNDISEIARINSAFNEFAEQYGL